MKPFRFAALNPTMELSPRTEAAVSRDCAPAASAFVAGSRSRDAATPHDAAKSGGVTLRVVVLSLVLAALFGCVVPVLDLQVRNTYLGAGHLPVGAVGALLLLLLVLNPLLKFASRARGGRWALGRNETLTVYATCLFSALVPGMGSESLFVSHLIGSFYYATPENRWLGFLQPYLRPWFSPALDAHGHFAGTHKQAVENWYNGAGAIPWGAWLVPLSAWCALVMASYAMLACLSVMLRAQWGEREALSFPLLRLPLEMTERSEAPGVARFFRNPMMWSGFALAVLFEGVNGLHVYFPDFPEIGSSVGLGALFTEPPWNQMAPMALILWPIFAAITFLLTAEVSLSLWAFLAFIQFQYVVAYYLGFPYGTLPPAIGHSSDGGGKTFTAFQQVGAYLSYAAILGWTAREHLRFIVRRAFGREPATAAEGREAMSYPLAFWGFCGSFAFIIAWSCAAGMRTDVAVALWGLYLVTATVLTRAIVEGGVMFINQGWVPLGSLAQLVGSGPGTWLGAQSIVPATFFQVSFFTDMRAFLMPSFLMSFKLAHDRGIAARRLCALIFAATLVALGAGVWMKVRMGYAASGLTLHPWFASVAPVYPARNSQALLSGTSGAPANWFWLGVGALFTVGLMAARARLAWFPLHPIGYLLALTAPTQRAWFSFFVGWLLKVTVTRVGGPDAYRKLIPAALGVILGEVSMFLLWLLIDAWQGRAGHGLLP